MAAFIGLMSGTSADGVDGVLASWSDAGQLTVSAHCHRPFDSGLRHEILALNTPGAHELHRSALAANALSRAYADVVASLLGQAALEPAAITALGAHGQTVRHRPGEFDGVGYTLQLLNGALLAELSGIGVVCDFRSRDVAASGQGAPLVPAFHRALFAEPARAVAVLNIGGMSNISLLPPADSPRAASVIGFDCGPGNVLMDLWCEQHTGQRYDRDGAWAARGQVDAALLERLLEESFFDRPPPKSTGRDLFDRAWLEHALGRLPSPPRAEDVQATLCELTAVTCARDVRRHGPACEVLRVCGGGASNLQLMARLAHHLPELDVGTTASVGVPVDQVEALAFAWLARAFVQGEPGNLPACTGAHGPRRLGTWHPAA